MNRIVRTLISGLAAGSFILFFAAAFSMAGLSSLPHPDYGQSWFLFWLSAFFGITATIINTWNYK